MPKDWQYIFVMDWGGSKEKNDFLKRNCMNGGAMY